MPKAVVKLPSGNTVELDGTVEEIEWLLKRLDGEDKVGKKEGSKPVKRKGRQTGSPMDYVMLLKDQDFFQKPKGLKDIKAALDTEGHIIPITTLSSTMLRIVKAKHLRRLKDGKVWKYVNR